MQCDGDAIHEACEDCDDDDRDEDDEDDDEDDGDAVRHMGIRGARICVHTVTSSCLYRFTYIYIYMNAYTYECKCIYERWIDKQRYASMCGRVMYTCR